MKILKESEILFHLVDDKGKKIFSASSIQILIEKLNKTLVIKKSVKK